MIHTENTMKYNPTEALKLLNGVTRKRLYEMMANGDISYKKENNKRLIDGSELARIFGDKFQPNTENKKTFFDTEKKQNDTLETLLENTRLSAELDAAKKTIEELKADKDDYKARLDKSQATIEKQVMVISDLRPKPPEKPIGRQKGFLATILGKTG